MSNKIKVLIIDDSNFIRSLFKQLLESDPNIEVVGLAANPIDAIELIASQKPDVLTLDIDMPKMDGITFLKQLMEKNPLPVVMVSSLTEKGANLTIEALAIGAIDFLHKPHHNLVEVLNQYKPIFISKVKAAAQVQLKRTNSAISYAKHATVSGTSLSESKIKIIAIGASTGGIPAITEIIQSLPPHCPPIVITQHIPLPFSASFASRLGAITSFMVHEAKEGQVLESGHVYIAPGDSHLSIIESYGKWYTKLSQTPEVNHHRPSVDVMMGSISDIIEPGQAIGIILTGMGIDGAAGLKSLHDAGCTTIAQDEATSIVFGMPKAAIRLEAVTYVEPINQIAPRIVSLLWN